MLLDRIRLDQKTSIHNSDRKLIGMPLLSQTMSSSLVFENLFSYLENKTLLIAAVAIGILCERLREIRKKLPPMLLQKFLALTKVRRKIFEPGGFGHE